MRHIRRGGILKKSNYADEKSYRMLSIYSKMQQGMALKKSALAQEFGVTERSIQRDIEALRNFLAEQRLPWEIVLAMLEDTGSAPLPLLA